MNRNDIIEYLLNNDISEVEELEYRDKDISVLRFFYDFDEDEINAAKAYADDESGKEREDEEWSREFFIPYLSELAVDIVGEVIEDLMEDLNLEVQFTSYEINEEEPDYVEFIGIFYSKGKEVDIDSILDELQL
ncbi:hypothetical protein BD780_002115 [Clostridium tetanomorphum]|uniref:Uncharacterized protein n=1 Tax=Clostridium tetanomorphum TaxID=1553 RepID=A0A923J0Q3_CLOTT|nr:hypothetical protein [Clostridium tetanomorphum]KAJ52158.1 hypothetical protein CTM_09171 [Clostridium tetanomorphum DSM 665]MBC2396488.1 hypothetical protein [Clostridium tetanomorphum]MBP1863812.1 hypothetical protein [Clostridium tetanomorphum]NRS84890.1 hypothetical protein [Clostridium tetanomorphum]NRZ98106.1 hypothetical protein [Clostridium tetanomorphum]